MNAVELERLLRERVAAVLALEPDKTIFRGVVPAEVCDALGVILEGFASGNKPAMRHWSAQILGRFHDRDRAMLIAAELDRLFPFWEPDLAVLKSGGVGVYPSRWGGNDVTGVSLNLEVIHNC